jgi:2-aminoadipate transaminase
VTAHFVQAKQGADLHTSSFSQMVAYETARDGFVEEHVEEIRRVYRGRRDLMLDLFDELMPPGVTWTRPRGGLFLWVTLPDGMNSADLLEKAVAENVAFVPGSPFFAHGGGENTMRINFSNATEEQIRLGIERLARVIRTEMEITAS